MCCRTIRIEPVAKLAAVELPLPLTALHNIDPDILFSQHLTDSLHLHVGAGSKQGHADDH
jgi:hypothetical protein